MQWMFIVVSATLIATAKEKFLVSEGLGASFEPRHASWWFGLLKTQIFLARFPRFGNFLLSRRRSIKFMKNVQESSEFFCLKSLKTRLNVFLNAFREGDCRGRLSSGIDGMGREGVSLSLLATLAGNLFCSSVCFLWIVRVEVKKEFSSFASCRWRGNKIIWNTALKGDDKNIKHIGKQRKNREMKLIAIFAALLISSFEFAFSKSFCFSF